MRPSDVRKKSLGKAAAKYALNLDRAASYLTQRGVSEATAVAAQLGVVVDPEPGHELFVGRLAIPYITRAGVVDMKFRCMIHEDCKQEGCVKYLAIAGLEGSRLYNVNAFFVDSPLIGLTEGELDADVLHYEVGIPAVGCPGVQRWEEYFARCFTGYESVLVFADGDTAGRDFGKRVASELLQATVINLPQGEDVNSVYLTEGADGLLHRAGLLQE